MSGNGKEGKGKRERERGTREPSQTRDSKSDGLRVTRCKARQVPVEVGAIDKCRDGEKKRTRISKWIIVNRQMTNDKRTSRPQKPKKSKPKCANARALELVLCFVAWYVCSVGAVGISVGKGRRTRLVRAGEEKTGKMESPFFLALSLAFSRWFHRGARPEWGTVA